MLRQKNPDGTVTLAGLSGMGDDRMRLLENYRKVGTIYNAKVTGTSLDCAVSWAQIAFPQLSKKTGAYGNDNILGWGDNFAFPADGTVIQGHNGANNQTVSGGVIHLGSNSSYGNGFQSSLWYEPQWDGNPNGGKYHIVGSGGASGSSTDFTVPANWFLICSVTPLYGFAWGMNERDSLALGVTYANGMLDYGGGYAPGKVRYKDGRAYLSGLIKAGTTALAANANVITGLLPPSDGGQHIFWSLYSSNTAMGRLDITADGRLITANGIAAGAWVSLDNISYFYA